MSAKGRPLNRAERVAARLAYAGAPRGVWLVAHTPVLDSYPCRCPEGAPCDSQPMRSGGCPCFGRPLSARRRDAAGRYGTLPSSGWPRAMPRVAARPGGRTRTRGARRLRDKTLSGLLGRPKRWSPGPANLLRLAPPDRGGTMRP